MLPDFVRILFGLSALFICIHGTAQQSVGQPDDTGYSLVFVVTSIEGEAVDDAVITLNGEEYGPGEYVFEDLPASYYVYSLSAEGFFDSEGEVDIIDQDVNVSVVMVPLQSPALFLEHVEAAPGSVAHVPLTSHDFNHMVAMLLRIQFDTLMLDLYDPEELLVNVHPLLQSAVTSLQGEHTIVVSWFSMIPRSIPDDESLFELRFVLCMDLTDCWEHEGPAGILFDEELSHLTIEGFPFPIDIEVEYHNGSVAASVDVHRLMLELEGAGSVAVNGQAYEDAIYFPGGSTVSVEASPLEEHSFVGWQEADEVVHPHPEYEFLIEEDRHLVARFAEEAYLVEASASGGGHIQPHGQILVAPGDTRTFYITAADGYDVADVLVDGSSIGPQADYTFFDIEQDHSIHALFEALSYTLEFVVADEQGEAIPDARVQIDGVLYGEGEYVFGGMHAGTYAYVVSREKYYDQEGMVEIVDQDVWVDVEMIPDETSLSEPVSPGLRVYPNPTRAGVYISSKEPMESLTLFDLFGRQLHQESVSSGKHHLDIASFGPGLYILRVEMRDGPAVVPVRVF